MKKKIYTLLLANKITNYRQIIYSTKLLLIIKHILKGITVNNGSILFVSTEPEIYFFLETFSKQVKPLFFISKWVGGGLTNNILFKKRKSFFNKKNIKPSLVVICDAGNHNVLLSECCKESVPVFFLSGKTANIKITKNSYMFPQDNVNYQSRLILISYFLICFFDVKDVFKEIAIYGSKKI